MYTPINRKTLPVICCTMHVQWMCSGWLSMLSHTPIAISHSYNYWNNIIVSAGYTCVHSYVSTKIICILHRICSLISEHKTLKLEEKVETLIQAINSRARHTAPEELDEEIVTHNEINIMQLPSQDAYSYGLQLLNIIESSRQRDELAAMLLDTCCVIHAAFCHLFILYLSFETSIHLYNYLHMGPYNA